MEKKKSHISVLWCNTYTHELSRRYTKLSNGHLLTKFTFLHVDTFFPSKVWSLLITAVPSLFLLLHVIRQKRRRKKRKKKNEERGTIPCCWLVLYVFAGPGGPLSHLCLRRQVLPQLPLPGFPTPSLALKIFLFFFLPPASAVMPLFLFSHFDCMYLSSESSG